MSSSASLIRLLTSSKNKYLLNATTRTFLNARNQIQLNFKNNHEIIKHHIHTSQLNLGNIYNYTTLIIYGQAVLRSRNKKSGLSFCDNSGFLYI